MGNTSDNSYHVLAATGIGAATLIDGLSVTRGYANGGGTNQSNGGGLLITGSSSLTLTNCTFSGNTAYNYGGGMYNASSSPTLSNCALSRNTASSSGAGIYNTASSPILTNCTFSENTASSFGGGMYNSSSSSPTLANCTFSGNTASSSGGGMYNYSSSPTLTSCTFSGNTASSFGGGTYNDASSSPTLTNCTVIGNTATSGGGMENSSSSSPMLTNCTFSANRASSYGAGIYNTSSSPILTNCIVWGSGSSAIYDDSSTPTVTYSDIQGGYSGTGNISVDPRFVRSSWTGPDGIFGTGDDDYGDLRMRGGSVCLDAGSNAAVPGGVTTDLAGNVRIQNGTVDLGAYEGGFAAPTSKVVYVDRNSVGTNNGTSWTNAFTSLQSAILAAIDGDTIRIADGTYKPTATTDRTISFALKSGVSIYGGYAGYGAANPDARDIVAYATALSGDISTVGTPTENSYHVLTGSGIGAASVVEGLSLTLGNGNGTGTNQRTGAGLLITGSSSLTLTNCTFTGNMAHQGGGMYNSYSYSLTLSSCTFSGNTASSLGAGMYNYYSSPTLTNCTFSANTAYNGGGMYNEYSSSLTLTNCTFTANTAQAFAGGMYNDSSSATLTNCTFSANEGGGMYNEYSSSSPILTNCTFTGNGFCGMYNFSSSPTLAKCTFSANEGGGMINLSFSSPTLNNCTFTSNMAPPHPYGYGGGMINSGSSPTLTNCTFSGNTASSSGGGMYNSGSSPTLTNCTFSGNTASSSGGGMYNYSSSPTLTSCTFSGNTASSFGGGMYNSSSSSPSLTNCIVWGSGSNPIYNSSSTPTITYSDIQGGYTGMGNINVDPLFVASPGNLRLQAGSPCVDAGDNSAVQPGITIDAEGNPRFVDYPGVHDPGAIVDMGGYERPASLAGSGGAFLTDGPQPGMNLILSSQLDVSSISATDVLIRTVLPDGSLGATVNATGFNYDPSTRTIRFNLSVTLPDGNYRATLLAGSVADTYGNVLAMDYAEDFFVFAGDANHDRIVDIRDLYILATNWQGTGKVFSQADFNYDGRVDAADLGILSSRWQASLPPPAPVKPVSLPTAPRRQAIRVINLIQ